MAKSKSLQEKCLFDEINRKIEDIKRYKHLGITSRYLHFGSHLKSDVSIWIECCVLQLYSGGDINVNLKQKIQLIFPIHVLPYM